MKYTDEYGTWIVEDGCTSLIEPSQKWFDENRVKDTNVAPPSISERLDDLTKTVDSILTDILPTLFE